MISVNWHSIRPVNGSQNDGFEELISQLARIEVIPHQKAFVRKGKPDAGVECFWILEDGTEVAWQAKYFTASLDETQWKQIDKSVRTLLEKHSKVTKYIVAVPVDPPDARVGRQLSMREKWRRRVSQWEALAVRKSMRVDFVAWWQSDLIERLQRPPNAGMLGFWFDKDNFTDQWFRDNLDKAVANLGGRYTPALNVELEIAKVFDGIARDNKFEQQYFGKLDKLLQKAKGIRIDTSDKLSVEYLAELESICASLRQSYGALIDSEIHPFDFSPIKADVDIIRGIFGQIEERWSELRSPEEKSRTYGDDPTYYLRQAFIPLERLSDFLESSTVELYNHAALLVDGQAGVGKSHLLADIAETRMKEGKATILLLGQHFTTDQEPWSQTLPRMGLKCTAGEFLEALNSRGQCQGSRVLLFVDAINEGAGRTLWPESLPGFLKEISKYPWVGVVLSVRSSYLRIVLPETGDQLKRVVRETHFGFRDVEYEATKIFFANYRIQLPAVPLIHPEFQNPLFLKLFCDGLSRKGLTRIPDGFQGISSVFLFFIESINQRLGRQFNYDQNLKMVQAAIRLLVEYRIKTELTYIPYDEGYLIIEDHKKKYGIQGNLLEAMVSEGILSKDLFWKSDSSHVEGLYFAYERLEDHSIVSVILDRIPRENVQKEVQAGGLLGRYLGDRRSVGSFQGIVEALSIQFPERYGLELYETVGSLAGEYEIAEAFVNSLLWRKLDSINSERASSYIEEVVFKFGGTYEAFWDMMVSVASIPGHSFNALWMHQRLFKIALGDRDAWWTQLIHRWFADGTSAKRLIDWAWSTEEKSHVSDESCLLSAMMLSWFLASSNRRLRDSATKALVCLLQERISVLLRLLHEFEGVNDPYVYERLFAVAYGCAARTHQIEKLREVADYVFFTIFDKDEVYPHVLLRDYARGVIEYVISLGQKLAFDSKRVHPPYHSDFPKIPSDDEVAKRLVKYGSPEFKEYHWGIENIFSSMEGEHRRGGKGGMYGDFGRYVFESDLSHWPEVDLVDLKNIAIERIFDLGYDAHKHGQFDRNSSKGDRFYVETERIGKKYQWIAMHELAARLADNFKMKLPWSGWNSKERTFFEGPWEPFMRNIDPTVLLRRKAEGGGKTAPAIFRYENWNMSHSQWLRRVSDLPKPQSLIEAGGPEWLTLEGYFPNREPKALGEMDHGTPYKEFWFIIRSYLVRANEFDTVVNALSHKNFMGGWMPESGERYQLFNREYYWSPAFHYFEKQYDEEEEQTIYDPETKKRIGDVIVTTESYLWEAEYDRSKDQALHLLKPSKPLFEGLRLAYDGDESFMFSQTGELICFDNSEQNGGNSLLQIKRKALLGFLKRNHYRLFWTVLGEKNILGDYGTKSYGRRPEMSGVYSIVGEKIHGKVQRY